MREFDFYIVPTPIGNLGDITLRAIQILKEVDVIACEDSRVTQKLLNHYDIKTKCISYHKYNEKERVAFILSMIKEGKKIALVSDAGTPLICDPGAVLVKELRENGVKITALAGANAVITLLSQISRSDEEFLFVGFLPKTSAKIAEIVQKNKYQNMVFYESPNRIINSLKIVQKCRPDATIAYGRELTKVFEEVIEDNVNNVIAHLENNIAKGEFVCVILKDDKENNISDYEVKIKSLKKKGYSAKDISVIISELFDVNKNEVYKYIVSKQM